MQGTCVNFVRTSILFLMLYLIFDAADHGRTVLHAAHLLVLHLRSAPGDRERHQHLSRDRGVARGLRADPRRCRPTRSRRRRSRSPTCACSTSRTSRSSTRRASAPALSDIDVPGQSRRDDRLRRTVRRRQDDAREAARRPLPTEGRPGSLQRYSERSRRSRPLSRAHRSRDAGRAALLRLDSRKPSVRSPRRHRRRMSRRAAPRRCRRRCSSAPTRVSTR